MQDEAQTALTYWHVWTVVCLQ